MSQNHYPRVAPSPTPPPLQWTFHNIPATGCYLLGGVHVRNERSSERRNWRFWSIMGHAVSGLRGIQNFPACSSLLGGRYIPDDSPALFTNAENFISQIPPVRYIMAVSANGSFSSKTGKWKEKKSHRISHSFPLLLEGGYPELVIPPPRLQLLQKCFFLLSPSFHWSRNRNVITEHGSVILVKC